MNDLDSRVREAFDDIVLPDSVRQETMQAIDRLETKDAASVSDAVSAAARRAKPARTRRFAIALAACLALCAIGFGGFTAFASETAQVSIDVNPSIELGLNRFDRVVSVRPINENGKQLIGDVDLVGMQYDEAMDTLSETSAFRSYVDGESFIEISVTSSDAGQAESLTRKSDAYIETLPCPGMCRTVSSENREEAASEGMGVGRYNAAQELMKLDPSVTLDDCREMSMHELRDRIAAAGGEDWRGQGQGAHRGEATGDGRGHRYGRQ